MKFRFLILLGLTLVLPAWGAEAPPMISEVTACNLKDGKSMEDVDRSVADWVEKAAPLPHNRDYRAAFLKPFRGPAKFDVYWMGFFPGMSGFATNTIATEASSEETALIDAINSNLDCVTAMYTTSSLFANLQLDAADKEDLVEVYICSLRSGKSEADVLAADKAWADALTAAKLPIVSTRFLPVFDQGSVYTAYLNVHEDLDSFGKSFDAVLTRPEIVTANALYLDALACEGSLWTGERLHWPAQ